MSVINKKNFFFLFVVINISLVIYIYFNGNFIHLDAIKSFLAEQNFIVSYLIFIGILIIRGLTLLPGTPFLLAGIFLFTIPEVFVAIQIAIISYCLIIFNFSQKLNFKIPQLILDYEEKVKSKEIPIIFSLCFVPGMSINVLIFFLTTIKIKLRSILIGVVGGTSITSLIYILLIKGVFESIDFLPKLLN